MATKNKEAHDPQNLYRSGRRNFEGINASNANLRGATYALR
jgi:hypothetical protein